MATWSDDFNRADGALGASWSTVAGTSQTNNAIGVISNRANVATTASTDIPPHAVALPSGIFADGEVSRVYITASTTRGFCGMRIEQTPSGAYAGAYGVCASSATTVQVRRFNTAGTTTVLGSQTVDTMTNAVTRFGMRITGDSIQRTRAGVDVGTALTDTTFTSGYAGLCSTAASTTGAVWDDFTVVYPDSVTFAYSPLTSGVVNSSRVIRSTA